MAISLATMRKLPHAPAPVRDLERLVQRAPAPWTARAAGQLALWETKGDRDVPWTRNDARPPRFACIGCGRPVARKHTYCRRCRKRLEVGLPVDLDDYVTDSEYRKLVKRMPGRFVVV